MITTYRTFPDPTGRVIFEHVWFLNRNLTLWIVIRVETVKTQWAVRLNRSGHPFLSGSQNHLPSFRLNVGRARFVFGAFTDEFGL